MRARRDRSRGIALLEALIALLLVTVGLLGAAYLHVYSQTAVAQVALRQAAVSLATEMANQILSDSANAVCYVLNTTAPTTINGTTVSCTSSAAQTYRNSWSARVASRLPSAGSANPNAVAIQADGTVQITLQWDINQDSAKAMFSVPHLYRVVTQLPS